MANSLILPRHPTRLNRLKRDGAVKAELFLSGVCQLDGAVYEFDSLPIGPIEQVTTALDVGSLTALAIEVHPLLAQGGHSL